MTTLAGLALLCAGAGCAKTGVAQAAPSWNVRTMIDDRTAGFGPDRFQYVGHWQSVSDHDDGRSLGTSTRSFHRNDVATLSFAGTQVRLYGVLGPKGGEAFVAVDGKRAARVSFRAVMVSPNALVYTSPLLAANAHTLTISVAGGSDQTSKSAGFTNIDGAVISNFPQRGE
ncbi:MAG: hypothetical protein IAI50_00565 [Candidatus Eremiobacteraeota bacterium]|nr:hypothetical protein [Candidatus Eremiobacteraeota bacterium]